MENRIRRITIRNAQLVPAQAELWIAVEPDHQTPTTEVRGRLMGPSCPYASTVEVAYPLRPLSPSQKPVEPAGLTRRAIIPEASLWEPQCPFLYQGPIELWQNGRHCDRAIVRHGLRTVQWTERGLHVNGRSVKLHGRRVAAFSEEEATRWHRAGYNLLIAPVAAYCLDAWEQADRWGFLVLGQLGEDADETRLMETLRPHASCLGWLSAECRALHAEEAVRWYMVHGKSRSM